MQHESGRHQHQGWRIAGHEVLANFSGEALAKVHCRGGDLIGNGLRYCYKCLVLENCHITVLGSAGVYPVPALRSCSIAAGGDGAWHRVLDLVLAWYRLGFHGNVCG